MEGTTPRNATSRSLTFLRRSGSTVFLWALVCGVFASRSSWAFLGLIGMLSIIATVEYFRMLRSAGVDAYPRFGLVMAVVYCATVYSHYLQGLAPPASMVQMTMFLTVAGAFAMQLTKPVRGLESLLAVAANLLGLVYIVLLFNFCAHLVFMVPGGLDKPGTVSAPGAFLLIWLLTVTKFTDMGAYITGSAFGRHKMIPHISPAKTWEGFAGALIFAQIAGCGLYAMFPGHLSFFGNWHHVIILGFILAVLAVIGDLAESVVKRALNAKDSGNLLPGIGGSLDLIDSVCFTAPALFFYIKWFLLPNA